MLANGDMLNGRQLAYLIWQEYKRDSTELGMTEFRDLQSIRLNGENLLKFVRDWDSCIHGMRKCPEEDVLYNLFEEQV